jgi:hypothetical protein
MITFNKLILFLAFILIVGSILYANMIDDTKDIDKDDIEFP